MSRGHIRERSGPKGRAWEVRVYAGVNPETGRARIVTRTVRTSKKDAGRVLTRLLAELDEGGHAGPDATLSTLLAKWREAASPDWSPSTTAAYDTYIRCHIDPALGDVRLRNLRPAHLDELYGRLRTGGLAAASVHKVHVILRRALDQAVRWGWLTHNPADRASPPKVPRRQLHPPTPDEVRILLEHADGTGLGVYIRLAAATGARRGELCALRWGDLDGTQLTIARSRVLGTRTVSEKTTKTGRARTIALDAATVAVIGAHRRRCVEAALADGVAFSDQSFLFSVEGNGATPWRPDGATSRFSTLRRHLGLDHVRLHDLRHYVATRLLAAGVDVVTVAGRLGHANANTTLAVYAHFVPAADQRAAEHLGALLDEAH